MCVWHGTIVLGAYKPAPGVTDGSLEISDLEVGCGAQSKQANTTATATSAGMVRALSVPAALTDESDPGLGLGEEAGEGDETTVWREEEDVGVDATVGAAGDEGAGEAGDGDVPLPGAAPDPEEDEDEEEPSTRAPFPHGTASPLGCVAFGGGVVFPEASAIAKRVVQ